MDSEEPMVESAGQAEGIRPSFAYTIGILLLVIIAALAGMTLSYRQRAQLAEYQSKVESQRQQASLQPLLNAMTLPLQEDDLTVVDATFNGRAVKVQVVKPERAAQLGLAPGEILLVGQSPETAPPAAFAPAATEPS